MSKFRGSITLKLQKVDESTGVVGQLGNALASPPPPDFVSRAYEMSYRQKYIRYPYLNNLTYLTPGHSSNTEARRLFWLESRQIAWYLHYKPSDGAGWVQNALRSKIVTVLSRAMTANWK